MISAADLAAFVGAPASDPYLTTCVEEATEMVKHAIGGARVPEEIKRIAEREVAADIYHRRSARNGVAGFDDSDITPAPVRINRDPMVAARPILRPYLGVAIA